MIEKNRSTTERILSHFINDPFTILSAFVSIAFFCAFIKHFEHWFSGAIVKYDFFPEFLYEFNMAICCMILAVLIFIRYRIAYFIGMVISFIVLVHPNTFSDASFIALFYVFLWLFAKDENHSVFLGRLLISFIFFGASVGKLTPAWVEENRLGSILGTDSAPRFLLVIIGELLVAVSFLMPLYIASLLSFFTLVGIIVTSMGAENRFVLLVMLPLLGMILTILSIKSTDKSELKLYFYEHQNISIFLLYFFEVLGISNIKLVVLKDETILRNVKMENNHIIYAQNSTNDFFYGLDCCAEIVSRTAAIAFLFPFFKLRKLNLFRK